MPLDIANFAKDQEVGNPIGIGTSAAGAGVRVLGDADAAIGALAFIKATGASGHAMTVFYSATTGLTQAALNVVSNNPQFSAMELTGVETAHGTLKIAHVGPNDQSDANAAAISIDLQTAAAGTGTAAQGIFITSTTDNPSTVLGHAFNARLNGLDWFKVEGANIAGSGIVGIGVGVGHVPIGMLEIAQKDTTTPGLFMKAIAAGADLVQIQDSGGTLRFQISNAGATVIRGTGFFSGNAIVGSTSGDFGGAGSALTICHSTDPSTNPAAGHVILFCDALGNLSARTSAGNVRIVAAV